MTMELVLLLGLFAFLIGGTMFGPKGPMGTFNKSGPRLAARIERQVVIGREFKLKGGQSQAWEKPDSGDSRGKIP